MNYKSERVTAANFSVEQKNVLISVLKELGKLHDIREVFVLYPHTQLKYCSVILAQVKSFNSCLKENKIFQK